MLELVIRLILLKTNLLHLNFLHPGHSMLMTTGKHPLHIQQLQLMEIIYLTLFTWDESNLRWLGKDDQKNTFAWLPDTSSWIATGN
jgi:hypothetical protein